MTMLLESEDFLAYSEKCVHYENQKDCNGDVALVFCNHPDNKNQYEGNCAFLLCPLLVDHD